MSARRWTAAGLVVFGVAFAGQALAGTELGQTFNDARQNGENLVEVVRLALQSGANLTDLAAAASEAGIAADIVAAAALSAGQEPAQVARAIERGSDSTLGYLEPTASRPLATNEETSGAPEVAGTGFEGSQALVQAERRNGGPGPCRSNKICQPASGPTCCQTASSDLPKCEPHSKCK